jgi:nascent polypeptide-associated complex subunit beta
MKRRVSTFYLCVVDNKCAELSDLLPGIMNQLGPDNIDHLKQLADNLSNSNKSTSMGEEHDDGDEDVPDLVENFEDVSKSWLFVVESLSDGKAT